MEGDTMFHRSVSKSSAWLGALAILGIVGAAPTAYGATIGFDLIFTCDTGCITGVDEPTGMFFLDDAALGSDANDVPVLSAMVTFGTNEWTYNPDNGDDTDLGPMVDVIAGAPSNFDWRVGDGGLYDTAPSITVHSVGNGWYIHDLIPPLDTNGHYTITPKAPIPEPTAALLFTLGAMLTVGRARRIAQDGMHTR